MSSAVIFCPGRGSYGKEELGTITRLNPQGELRDALEMAERERAEAGEPSLLELDQSERFRPSLHLAGRNAAELIYFATMAQLPEVEQRHEILAVAGNSLGWYTALAASGALNPRQGLILVRTMARLQEKVQGAQVLTTVVDEQWQTNPALERAVAEAIEHAAAISPEHYVAPSIQLGGHRVLAGTKKGVDELMARLPRVESGKRSFPMILAGHGPFHTKLCRHLTQQAQQELRRLSVHPPARPLIDGRGGIHSPWSASPNELLSYTLGAQVSETFDFSATVRTAMREFQPDSLLCLGPGSTLRAPVGHIVLDEGWCRTTDKASLFASDLVLA